MVSARTRRVGLLLVALLCVGGAAVISRPDGVPTSEMWPVGLAVPAVMTWGLRRSAPVVAAIALITFATFQVSDRPWDYSVGAAISTALEALVVAAVLTDGGTRKPSLVSDSDFHRFLLGSVAGGVVAATGFTLTAAATLDTRLLLIFNGTLCGHLSSILVLTPFFMRTLRLPALGGTLERWLQWGMVVLITVAAFGRDTPPAMLFAIFPVIGWGALRARLVDVQFQLLAVVTIGTVLTTFGHGPLAESPGLYDLPGLVRGAALQIFFITMTAVAIPLSMVVGQQSLSLREAHRERDLAHRVVRSAHVAIIGSDEVGRITMFNPGAQRLLGWKPEEVMGRPTTLFHSDAEIGRMAEILAVADTFPDVAVALAREDQGPAQMWFKHADGSERLLSVTLKPTLTPAGDTVGYVATAEDVTERERTHQALLDALEKERAAVQQLQEVDRVKDAFVSSVSHELRTPMTNIVGYLELMQDGVYGVPTPGQTDAMGRIDMNARRLLTLIDDLLTLSSMESIDQRRRRGQVDLVGVVKRAVEIVRPGLQNRDLTLVIDVPEHPVIIIGDNGELERLVINLATNAVKFTPDGGTITVRLRGEGDDAGPVLEVLDTGIGIREEDRAMLFTRFFRTSHAHELNVPGSGLGLSIAKAITEVHGGRISASSVHGEGSTFRVEFPRQVVAAAG